jgi:hypothetical protein
MSGRLEGRVDTVIAADLKGTQITVDAGDEVRILRRNPRQL